MDVGQPLHPAFPPAWRSPATQIQVVLSSAMVRLAELGSFDGFDARRKKKVLDLIAFCF
jgi:hypothetical protein